MRYVVRMVHRQWLRVCMFAIRIMHCMRFAYCSIELSRFAAFCATTKVTISLTFRVHPHTHRVVYWTSDERRKEKKIEGKSPCSQYSIPEVSEENEKTKRINTK